MRGNLERCLAETLRHEGGWSDHPADPGGATMGGVTLATYRQFRPGATKDDLRAITDAELGRIYREGYWDKVRGDELPAGMDLVAFDGAVNSGPRRGARWLQSALGVTADGVVGPETIAAAEAHGNPRDVIRRACQGRMRWLRGLKTWSTFGRGWTARVAAIEAAALAMAEEPVSSPAPTKGPVATGWLARIIAALVSLLRGPK